MSNVSNTDKRALLTVIAGVAVILSSALYSTGQSGRRAANPKTVAAPSPEPTATPEQQNKEEPKPAHRMIVGIDSGSGFENIPLYLYSAALYGCAEKLDESPSVKVDGTYESFSRGQAISKAKAEKEGYVVWLQLRGESTSADRSVQNIREIHLEYALFAPGTAKQITSGRTYQRAGNVGDVILNPGGRNNSAYAERLVKQAARDAAQRILAALQLPGRRLPP